MAQQSSSQCNPFLGQEPTRYALRFLSRHQPTEEQRKIAASLGYPAIKQIDVGFTRDPVHDLARLNIMPPAEIAVVAPAHVIIPLVRAGFTVLEFENAGSARATNEFSCSGVFRICADSIDYFPVQP